MTKLLKLFDQNPHLHAIMSAFSDAGFHIHLVGGAVRNTLLDLPVTGFGLVTDATPHQIEKTAYDAGMSARLTNNPNGTVVVIHDKKFVEVTPWQGSSLEEDALHRDLTVNTIYASIDGTLSAMHKNALPDLAAGRARFASRPVQSIEESPLRMLRLLRISLEMSGRVDHQTLDFDTCTIMANQISSVDPIQTGKEVRKMLGGAHPGAALSALARSHLLHYLFPSTRIGLLDPIPDQSEQLSCLRATEITEEIETSFLHRLALISAENYLDLHFKDTVQALALSRRETKEYKVLLEAMNQCPSPAALGFFHGEDVGIKMLMMTEAAAMRVPTQADFEEVRRGANKPLPITYTDLPEGLEGSEIGAAFAKAKAYWVDSDFTADRSKLLAAASL